jgi:hypothetical protein
VKKNIVNMATQILQGFMTCERCGNCCKNAPAIELTYADLLSIAKHFSIPVEEARQLYARSANELGSGKIAIKNAKPCMFYAEGAGCEIYDHRPKACEQYPFIGASSLSMGAITIRKTCPGAVTALETLEKIKEHTRTCQVCKTYGSAVCEEVKKILGRKI